MKVTRRDANWQVEAVPYSRPRVMDDALLERAVQIFEARTGRSLSKEEARQIVENVSGSFASLPSGTRWIESDRPAPDIALWLLAASDGTRKTDTADCKFARCASPDRRHVNHMRRFVTAKERR
ncbi:hypothetical protein [Mesorhizobium sp. NZP2077]|uniref:hypothetical protein n=1 Tax=Mesorhizobium sp. NZP2077 TaxID=2483404 RepID=UPI001AEDB7F5|nr:hypothetical protein [Mesorhizobium sp. NZP2077]